MCVCVFVFVCLHVCVCLHVYLSVCRSVPAGVSLCLYVHVCVISMQVLDSELKMARRQYSPQERLGNFLLNKEISPATVETLRNFLCNYEPTYRSRIINAPLAPFHNRTSVHLVAEKGLTPFLHILLKHGGGFQ